MFSGGTFAQFREMADVFRLQITSDSSFYELQNKYIFGAINKVYKLSRSNIISGCIVKKSVNLSGDGRCDSPGYNTKYCTYSVMDQSSSQNITLQRN